MAWVRGRGEARQGAALCFDFVQAASFHCNEDVVAIAFRTCCLRFASHSFWAMLHIRIFGRGAISH